MSDRHLIRPARRTFCERCNKCFPFVELVMLLAMLPVVAGLLSCASLTVLGILL